jgi:aryl-alcohol dehydrogenase-like predicted oxidoreductase
MPRPGPERVQLTDDYSVSRIIVGGWQFSPGHGAHSETGTDPVELFSELVDLGFTTFDCADIYRGVEEFLGSVLKRVAGSGGSSPVQIHTKFVPDLDVLPSIDRAYVETIIDRSLTRLGVEQLDLLQFHWWDFDIPGFLDVARWLADLREAGKIGHLGVTNFDRHHLEALVSEGIPILSNQVQYSVLDRRPAGDLSAFCREQGIHLLCYGALSGGFLTDRWAEVLEPPPEIPNRSLVKYRLIIEESGGWAVFQGILSALRAVAAKSGVETASAAIRWVLDQPQVAATITGVDSLNQARGLQRALELTLDEEDRRTIQDALEATTGPFGPVYGFERDREGPHGRIMRYNLNRE